MLQALQEEVILQALQEAELLLQASRLHLASKLHLQEAVFHPPLLTLHQQEDLPQRKGIHL